MLKFENGKFHALGVSFTLPDGFYLETVPDFCYIRGFGAWTPDRKNYVEWQIEDGCGETEQELKDLFYPGTGMILLGEIKPISVNGLRGHMAIYKTRDEEIMEMRLMIEKDKQIILLVRNKECIINEALRSEEIRMVVNGIKPD